MSWPIPQIEEFSLATRLDRSAKAGATSIVVRAPILDWTARMIRIRSRDGATTETRTVASVVGRTVTVTVALTNAYAAGSVVEMLLEEQDMANFQAVEFVPVEYAYNITDATAIARGNPATDPNAKFGFLFPDNKVCSAIGKVRISSSYSSDLVVKAVLRSAGTGDLYHKIRCYFGKAGEDFTNTSVVPDYAAEAVTASEIAEKPKVSSGLTVEVSDYLTLEYLRDGTDILDTVNNGVYVAGFLVYYNAIPNSPSPDPI
jgi:hypothetical protein